MRSCLLQTMAHGIQSEKAYWCKDCWCIQGKVHSSHPILSHPKYFKINLATLKAFLFLFNTPRMRAHTHTLQDRNKITKKLGGTRFMGCHCYANLNFSYEKQLHERKHNCYYKLPTSHMPDRKVIYKKKVNKYKMCYVCY